MLINPGIYQHFKGNKYRVLSTARHSETGDDLVIYEPLYPSESKLWARPLSMFLEQVPGHDGVLVPRFAYLSE